MTLTTLLKAVRQFGSQAEDEGYCGCELMLCDDGSGSLIINRFVGDKYESLIVLAFGDPEEVLTFVASKPLARCEILAQQGDEFCWYPAGIRRALLQRANAGQPQTATDRPEEPQQQKRTGNLNA